MRRMLILVVLAAGCGVGRAGDDHGDMTGSGSNQPTPTPTPTNNVLITVRLGEQPTANVPVIFQNKEGANLGIAMTDTTGTAAGAMPLGGTVSIVFPAASGDPSRVYSYEGVKANDHLTFVGPAPATAVDTIRVIVPPAPSGGPVSITTPCGSTTGDAPTISIDLVGCGMQTQTDFYVSDGVNAGFLKRAAVAAQIDLSAETYRNAVATTLAASNLPDNGSATLEKRLETDLLHPAFTTGALSANVNTTDATVDASVPDVAGIQQLVVARVNDDDGVTTVSARAAYTATATTIDVGAGLMPAVSGQTLASETVIWSETGAGGSADFSIVAVRTPAVIHMIAAAHADASVKIPDLPAGYTQYNLASSDLPALDVAILRVSGGYDAVRAIVFNGDPSELAPMGGTLSVSSAQQ